MDETESYTIGPKIRIPNGAGPIEEESSLDKGIVNEDEEIARLWSPYLYSLQRRAPRSRILPMHNQVANNVGSVEKEEELENSLDHDWSDLGNQYHGLISKAEAVDKLIGMHEGAYLVRKKPSGQYVVSFKFDDDIRHYVITRLKSKFLYGDKEFDSISDLVDDSLIFLYLEKHDISKHLTIGRARHRTRKIKRRNGLRYKSDEDQKRVTKFRNLSRGSSENSDSTDGVIHDELPEEPEELVQVFVEDEGGKEVFRKKAFSANLSHSRKSELEENGGINGVFRALSENDSEKKEQEGENSRFSKKIVRGKTSSEKVKHSHGKRFHLPKKEGGMNMSSPSNRKSCPHEIVNLLSIYTKAYSDKNNESNLNKTKSVSTGNLVDISSTGAVSHLLRSTVLLHSDENVSESSSAPISRNNSTSSYGKTHNFKVATYKGATWCDLCHHFLWGLVQQGMTCQDCGINIHKQCSLEADAIECIPTKKVVKRVFGVDLTTVVLVDDKKVPKFLNEATKELESKALQCEGIYRVAGRTLHILELKDKVDENDNVDFSLVHDVHVISSAVKLFLRELPIPLITFDAYPHLMNAIKDDKIDCSTIKQLLTNHLPKAHYDTLRHVIQHLTRVVKFSDENKMQSSNLAVVFAPTILRSPNTDDLLLRDIPLQKKLVEFLIDNCSALFDS